VEEGFSTVDEVAYVPLAEMLSVEEFDEELVHQLRNRAKDVLLTRAIASEETHLGEEPAEDLLSLDGMDEDLAVTLARNAVITREDLAEQSVDELTDLAGIDAERAARLIMKAREHWFAAAESE
jgi:transcription termination/antitermination protein NusA